MVLISHRGNLDGPKPKLENNPAQVKSVILSGFDCEIDVWNINGHFILGHDRPSYPVKEKFLENKKLWCHAKNLQALEVMLGNKNIHCFWHENDDFTLTSKNFIWTFPEKSTSKKSVVVSLDKKSSDYQCYGICTDYPGSY
jgi:hypothetical protein